MDDIPEDLLPDQVPMAINFSRPLVYNTLLPYSGGCEFYVLPSGGLFNIPRNNLTNYSSWASNNVIIYALNCNYTDAEYMDVWNKVMKNAPRVSFASSLSPLMVVLTMCVVTSWIIIGLMAVLKRFKRPITHQITMIYICVLLTVLYVYLHHFSREEHMGGFESTDTFTHYFFSTKRAIAVFMAFTGIMLCECHVIYSIYTNPRHRLIILLVSLGWFAAVQGVWIAGVADHRAYNIHERVLSSKIQLYFYLDIVSHAFYAITYIIKVLSLWRYAFTKCNAPLAILSCLSTAVPFISMIVTTIPSGCFRWSLPLSMVLRSISLVLAWDWHVYTVLYKTERETDDPLGRLITQHDVKKELKNKLGHDGDGHGVFFSQGLRSRFMNALQHPKSLLSSISIFEAGEQDMETNGGMKTEFNREDSTEIILSNTGQHKFGARRDSIIQHHPVAKHKITNKDSALKPLDKSDRIASNGRQFVTQSNDSSPSCSGSRTTLGTTAVPESSSVLTQTQPSTTISSNSQPGPSTSAPSEEVETPPAFVPHPGFRSGDYNNEKH